MTPKTSRYARYPASIRASFSTSGRSRCSGQQGLLLLLIGSGTGLVVMLAVVPIELPALFRAELIVREHNVRHGEQTLRTLRSP